MLTRKLLNLPAFGQIEPFAEIARLRREMDTFSDLFFRGLPKSREFPAGVFPLINLTETKDNYYIRAELPGMKAGDIELQVIGRSLTIYGERKIPSEGENVKYHRSEREAGKFSRIIGLPGEIDADKVQAKISDGLLTITLPKAEASKPKRIAIQ